MSGLEVFFVLAFFVFVVLFVLLLINAIHFYCVHYRRISNEIDGQCFDGGFLFAASRFMLWGHYCLSKQKAVRSGVDRVFSSLPVSARAQLLFHWFGMMYGAIVLLTCGGLMLIDEGVFG